MLIHSQCARNWLSLLLLISFSSAWAEASNYSFHTKTLAASCAACHGTNGNSVGGTSVLAGLDQSHFILQMQSFRSGERSSTVMHRHAKGLTVDEIEQLAAYFSDQKRVITIAPVSRTLDVNRDF
jgi:sulfide dehydrogenase cytochrome subunit